MNSIGNNLIGNLNSIANNFTTKAAPSEAESGLDFKSFLNNALERFEQVGDQNAQSTLDLLSGNTDDLSNTMIASQKAEIALDLTVAIRNKALDAYKEIMSMQV